MSKAENHRFCNPLNTLLGAQQQLHTLLNAHFGHIIDRRIT
jgi:hypothetical protein